MHCSLDAGGQKGEGGRGSAAGEEATFIDEAYPAVLNSFGTRIYSMGQVNYPDNTEEIKIYKDIDENKKTYKKIFFQKNIITGFILINDYTSGPEIIHSIEAGF